MPKKISEEVGGRKARVTLDGNPDLAIQKGSTESDHLWKLEANSRSEKRS